MKSRENKSCVFLLRTKYWECKAAVQKVEENVKQENDNQTLECLMLFHPATSTTPIHQSEQSN